MNISHSQARTSDPNALAAAAERTETVRIESNRFKRRVMLYKRAGMTDPNGEIHVTRAVTADELMEAYRLVHDVYRQQGYIVPQRSGMRIRIYEALPEMATFVAKVGGRIIGVMGLVPDSEELGLPSDRSFGRELTELRRQGRAVAEVTNLAVDEAYRRSTAFLQLSQAVLAHAINIGMDDLFSAISPGHSGFVEAILQFKPWGGSRQYGCEVDDTVEGKRLNLRTLESEFEKADVMLGKDAFLYNWFYTGNPHFESARAAMSLAEQYFRMPELIRRLFGGPNGLLSICNKDELGVIRTRFGQAFDCLMDSVGTRASSGR